MGVVAGAVVAGLGSGAGAVVATVAFLSALPPDSAT